MTPEEFVRRFPSLYHATRAVNRPGLVKRGCLLCPDEIYRGAGRIPTRALRKSSAGSSASGSVKYPVPSSDGIVYLSDHDPLHEGNIRFESGWNMQRFVALLDSLVFFWPGDERGPGQQGRDHYERYAKAREPMIVIRVSTAEIVAQNDVPMISSCNSGAPRTNAISKKQPRGGATFRDLSNCTSGGEIVEVVFRSRVRLPASTEVASAYDAPWLPLF